MRSRCKTKIIELGIFHLLEFGTTRREFHPIREKIRILVGKKLFESDIRKDSNPLNPLYLPIKAPLALGVLRKMFL